MGEVSGAAQGHEVKGACSSFKELAGRSGRQVNGQAAARRGPCVGARRDCSGVTARGWLGPPVSGARPGACESETVVEIEGSDREKGYITTEAEKEKAKC